LKQQNPGVIPCRKAILRFCNQTFVEWNLNFVIEDGKICLSVNNYSTQTLIKAANDASILIATLVPDAPFNWNAKTVPQIHQL
jgi:hypothetical protein